MFTHKYEIFISKSTHEVHIVEGMHRKLLKQNQVTASEKGVSILSASETTSSNKGGNRLWHLTH